MKLLSPTTQPWGRRIDRRHWPRHFELEDDRLSPRNSGDSRYTLNLYDLNDPRKIAMRERRRELLAECLEVVHRGPDLGDRLLDRAIAERDADLLNDSELMDLIIQRAWRDLLHFQAIPPDAEASCSCDQEEACSIPEVLEEQLSEIQPCAASD